MYVYGKRAERGFNIKILNKIVTLCISSFINVQIIGTKFKIMFLFSLQLFLTNKWQGSETRRCAVRVPARTSTSLVVQTVTVTTRVVSTMPVRLCIIHCRSLSSQYPSPVPAAGYPLSADPPPRVGVSCKIGVMSFYCKRNI